MVNGLLHVSYERGDLDGTRDIVGDRKECLLVHLTSIGMIASEALYLVIYQFEKSRVNHAGVAVVFYHEYGLLSTY